MLFENKLTKAHRELYSRYIASWLNIALKESVPNMTRPRIEVVYGDDFMEWLRSIGLTEDEISEIRDLATNGKLEMETSAYRYITTH